MRDRLILGGSAVLLMLVACGRSGEQKADDRPDGPVGQWSSLEKSKQSRAGLGSIATPVEIAKLAITALPDGRGLPPGSGSVPQGGQIYAEQCAACHGMNGEGQGDFPRLVGGQGTLATTAPVQTIGSFWPRATTVFDYIHRAMPYNTPGSLTPDQTYAVTAYLLNLNGILGSDAVLNRHNLAAVKMPNRDGFVGDPRPDVGRRQ